MEELLEAVARMEVTVYQIHQIVGTDVCNSSQKQVTFSFFLIFHDQNWRNLSKHFSSLRRERSSPKHAGMFWNFPGLLQLLLQNEVFSLIMTCCCFFFFFMWKLRDDGESINRKKYQHKPNLTSPTYYASQDMHT